MILRTTYTGTGGGVVEDDRFYYCQNWRADVSVILDDAGVQQERVIYSPYGQPFAMPAGDTNFDGDHEAGVDGDELADWENNYSYHAYADVNLDGNVNSADATASTEHDLGWNVLTSDGASGVNNRLGYAGYIHDRAASSLILKRVLTYSTALGRTLQRLDQLVGPAADLPPLYSLGLREDAAATDATSAGTLDRIIDWIDGLLGGGSVAQGACMPLGGGLCFCMSVSYTARVRTCCCYDVLERREKCTAYADSELCLTGTVSLCATTGIGRFGGRPRAVVGVWGTSQGCPRMEKGTTVCRWRGCIIVSIGFRGQTFGCRFCQGGWSCGYGIGFGTGGGGQACRVCTAALLETPVCYYED